MQLSRRQVKLINMNQADNEPRFVFFYKQQSSSLSQNGRTAALLRCTPRGSIGKHFERLSRVWETNLWYRRIFLDMNRGQIARDLPDSLFFSPIFEEIDMHLPSWSTRRQSCTASRFNNRVPCWSRRVHFVCLVSYRRWFKWNMAHDYRGKWNKWSTFI